MLRNSVYSSECGLLSFVSMPSKEWTHCLCMLLFEFYQWKCDLYTHLKPHKLMKLYNRWHVWMNLTCTRHNYCAFLKEMFIYTAHVSYRFPLVKCSVWVRPSGGKTWKKGQWMGGVGFIETSLIEPMQWHNPLHPSTHNSELSTLHAPTPCTHFIPMQTYRPTLPHTSPCTHFIHMQWSFKVMNSE